MEHASHWELWEEWETILCKPRVGLMDSWKGRTEASTLGRRLTCWWTSVRGDTGNTQRGFMISQEELEKKRGPECPVSEMLYHTNWCLFPNAGRTDVDIKHQFFSVIHLITFRTYDVTGKRDEVCKFQVCRHSNGSNLEMTLSKPRKSHWKKGDRYCGSAGRLLSSTCEVSSPIQHCIPTERGIIRGVGGWCLNF